MQARLVYSKTGRLNVELARIDFWFDLRSPILDLKIGYRVSGIGYRVSGIGYRVSGYTAQGAMLLTN